MSEPKANTNPEAKISLSELENQIRGHEYGPPRVQDLLYVIQALRQCAEALQLAEQLEIAVYGSYDKCHTALAELKKKVEL